MIWRQVFPAVVDVPNSDLKVVVIDTNDDSSNIITNAFGRLNSQSSRRVRDVITRLDREGTPFVVAIHHHLAQPKRNQREPLWPWLQSRCLTMINASELIDILGTSRHTVVFHGHNHVEYEGTLNRTLHIVSGRSTTLGNPWDSDGLTIGFNEVSLGWDAVEGTRIAAIKSNTTRYEEGDSPSN